jgi:hypothetical protein
LIILPAVPSTSSPLSIMRSRTGEDDMSENFVAKCVQAVKKDKMGSKTMKLNFSCNVSCSLHSKNSIRLKMADALPKLFAFEVSPPMAIPEITGTSSLSKEP